MDCVLQWIENLMMGAMHIDGSNKEEWVDLEVEEKLCKDSMRKWRKLETSILELSKKIKKYFIDNSHNNYILRSICNNQNL